MDVINDEALAGQAIAGDARALETLVTRYQDRVYRLARRLSGSDSDAEDILQETFLQLFRRLETFRGDAKFSTWLFRVTMNAALMHRRAHARHPTEPLDDYLPGFDDEGAHRRLDVDHSLAARADEILDRSALAKNALDAVQRLPEIYRAAFVLRDLEELTTAEVAEVLGVDAAAVRQRIHRARLLLRGYLSHLVGVAP